MRYKIVINCCSTEIKNKDRRDSVEKFKHSKSVDEKHNKSEHVSRNQSHDRRSSDSSNSERKTSGPERDRRLSESSRSALKQEHAHYRHDHSPSKHSRYSSESQELIPSAEDIR